MSNTNTMRAFVESSNIDARLIRATVHQAGGWEDFRSAAQDVVDHGADCGFGGFCHYCETVAFAKKYRPLIVALAEEQAQEYGIGTAEMIAGFSCLKGQYSVDEVSTVLYGPKKNGEDEIYNALAWYLLEEVCHAFEYFSE